MEKQFDLEKMISTNDYEGFIVFMERLFKNVSIFKFHKTENDNAIFLYQDYLVKIKKSDTNKVYCSLHIYRCRVPKERFPFSPRSIDNSTDFPFFGSVVSSLSRKLYLSSAFKESFSEFINKLNNIVSFTNKLNNIVSKNDFVLTDTERIQENEATMISCDKINTLIHNMRELKDKLENDNVDFLSEEQLKTLNKISNELAKASFSKLYDSKK